MCATAAVGGATAAFFLLATGGAEPELEFTPGLLGVEVAVVVVVVDAAVVRGRGNKGTAGVGADAPLDEDRPAGSTCGDIACEMSVSV